MLDVVGGGIQDEWYVCWEHSQVPMIHSCFTVDCRAVIDMPNYTNSSDEEKEGGKSPILPES